MNERIKQLYLHAFPPSLNDSNLCQISAEQIIEHNFSMLIAHQIRSRGEA